MTLTDLQLLLKDLEDGNTASQPPLPIPKITPQIPLSEYGTLTVKHLLSHYPIFFNYLLHNNQLCDFVYPWQQLMNHRASQLNDELLRYHNATLFQPRFGKEDKVTTASIYDDNPESTSRLSRELEKPVRNMILRRYLYPFFPLSDERDDYPF